MEDNAGKVLVLNGTAIQADGQDAGDIPGKGAVYEVIRIIDKVPLFFEDHYVRLKNSLSSTGTQVHITEKGLNGQLRRTIEENGLENCNVKVIVYNKDGIQNCLSYISKSYYPSDEEIKKGVPTGLIRLERANPNAKVVNRSYRELSDKRIKEGNLFEALLVNAEGRITEGSKSNVFFIKGSTVYTAPGEFVLKGITRKYIIDAIRSLGFEFVEALTGVEELGGIDGLFISGTSIKVLPVASIDGILYDSAINPVITAIRDGYDRIITDYIRQH